MSDNASTPNARPGWPGWVRVIVSLLVVLHLAAVTNSSLVASSGPWPTLEGMDMATPPQFAQAIAPWFAPYLGAVKLHHNYHFAENYVADQLGPGTVAVLEIRLKDAEGNDAGVLHYPDPSARGAVRHRQKLLAEALNRDELVEPLPGERIPAPNQPVNTVRFWEFQENQPSRIGTIPEHLIPRDRPVYGPSDWSMVVARSLSRYALRSSGAASAEIVRRSKPYIPPDVLFDPSLEGANFEESVVSFGVIDAKNIGQ